MSMRAIQMYSVWAGATALDLPEGAEIIGIQNSPGGVGQLCVLADTYRPVVTRNFFAYYLYDSIPDGEVYIGQWTEDDEYSGGFTYFLFEQIEAPG